MATKTEPAKPPAKPAGWRLAADLEGVAEGYENLVLLYLPGELRWNRKQLGYRLGQSWYDARNNGKVYPSHWIPLPEAPTP